jgi:hypothetical protein
MAQSGSEELRVPKNKKSTIFVIFRGSFNPRLRGSQKLRSAMLRLRSANVGGFLFCGIESLELREVGGKPVLC